jgi:ATP-binding cassette subfamily C (CFTR/MRP) protein 4
VKDNYIEIDGINISTIGLHVLRENISIIPQSPFVFSENIRKNLDPLDEF